jgi:hypothetical protein
MSKINYIKIKDILNEWNNMVQQGKFQNISLYGIITFISPPKPTKQNNCNLFFYYY